jgi:4-amino-4-deoxychorismate lyase
MCRCIESIKLLDGTFFRTDRHQARIDQAFEALWPENKPFVLLDVLTKSHYPAKGLYKCRIVYDAEVLQVEFTPYIRREINSLQVVETDLESCRFKKENRDALNRAFAQRGQSDDVLLVRRGLITDTSYSNIALFDGQKWYTPRSPLLYGTNRAELVENTEIVETDIYDKDISNFLKIRLFNALIEFGEIELDINQIRL